jgi:outer membrane lipoprotein SlyB
MKKTMIATAVVSLALGGCAAQPQFSSEKVGSVQFSKDRSECRLMTTRNFPTNSYVSAGLIPAMVNIKQQNEATEFFNDCMTARGYKSVSK